MQDIPPVLDLQSLARALGGDVSNGQVLAPGPGHSPQDRSLAVRPDPNAPGGFIIHSFSNDDVNTCKDYVRSRCGLPTFKPNGNGAHRTEAEVENALRAAIMRQRPVTKANVLARYRYTDENGELLYEVERLEPKRFRQRRPDDKGHWIWNLNDTRRVLYRLQELLTYPDATAFITEGEKDADRVASLGHCATTVASGRWEGVDVSVLTGRDVLIIADADTAGEKKALAAAKAVHAVAKTIRIVRLPTLTGDPGNKDVSDWLDNHPISGAKLFVDACFECASLWEPAKDTVDINKLADKDQEPVNEEPDTPSPPSTEPPAEKPAEMLPPLAFIDITAWQDQPAPERSWVVKDRIPLDNVTLLSGEGSVGKSILSLHLAVATVLGRDWASTMPEFGPALVVACEDDADELHRRLDAIVKHYGASFADLGDLHVVSLAGQDALMATPNRNGLMVPTKLFKRVHQAACDIKPKLIVLDNSADIFGGAENDRAQVRQFIGLLRGLAMAANAGVLLTSHAW